MVCAEEQGSFGAAGERYEYRPLGVRCVHHGKRVGRELLLPIGIGLLGPVRTAVAATIERDHSDVAGEVRNLRLPEARVDDRPGGQKHHRRRAVAVLLPKDSYTLALHVAGTVGIAGARLLAGGAP